MVKINLKTLIALFSVCCFFMPQSVMAQSAEDKKFVEKLYNSLDNIEARDSIISRLTRILEGNARFHKARFILAYLLEKKGFENLAIDAYKICIKQDPENFQYHYQLLLIAIRSLNNSLIFEELASLKRLSQDDGEKLLRLAFVMDNANYTSVATGLFEEAVKARKNSKAIAYRMLVTSLIRDSIKRRENISDMR